MITRIGNHIVRHGDVMDEEGMAELLQSTTAEFFYSDPPWGQGNLKYWQTMNLKMTNTPPKEVNLDAFLNRIFELAANHCHGIVWIEYGVRWRETIVAMGEMYGLRHLGIAHVRYSSQNLPLDLHVFRHPAYEATIPSNYFASLEGLKGYRTLELAVTPLARPGATIIDPCCGMGYTAQIAKDTGMKFIGNELNAARLQKAINRLRK